MIRDPILFRLTLSTLVLILVGRLLTFARWLSLEWPADDFEFRSDAKAIRATEGGVRCMISDRMKHRLPMQPSSAVEVSDSSGRVVHQLAIADLLRQALEPKSKPEAPPNSNP